MSDYIPKEFLVVGALYIVEARSFIRCADNMQTASWNGKCFEGLSCDSGFVSISEEFHYDDDPKYGTVKPLRKIV